MGIFNQWGKQIVDSGNKMGQAAKDFQETAKRNSMISDCEKKIQSLYLEIGKQYFQLYADNGVPELDPLVREIHSQQQVIQQLTEEIKQIKGVARCPYCGGENPIQAAFCSSCGKVLKTQPAVAVEKPMIFCMNCGSQISADAVFCNICGTKVEREEAAVSTDNYIQNIDYSSSEIEAAEQNGELEYPIDENGLDVVETADEEVSSELEKVTTEKDLAALQEGRPVEEEIICSNCGNKIGAGYVFCPECGTRISE